MRKHILVKAYFPLWQIEEAIEIVKKSNSVDTQLSVLGKLAQPYSEINEEGLIKYWKQVLGRSTNVGFCSNPEIGTIFIIGPLVSMFLHDLDGKKLGAMSEGPYGIFRGLGVNKSKTTYYIKKLDQGHYLLIVRGHGFEPDILKATLKKLE